MFPVNAMDAPIAAVIGRRVPQKIGSPTPHRGPIRPILMLPMVPSSMSAPFAFVSSRLLSHRVPVRRRPELR